ncbi:MAG TPA: hypothetical protein VHY35_15985 [Stellaceae bacterium]|nr:hypothetical protein [Stellaceae bacterium]
MFYYCLIRWLRPRRIVDIGGGFATLIADAAIRKNGFGEIISIAPNPAPFIERIETVRENIRTPLQQIPLEQLTELMDSADILFTDTTHSVKIGSDCLYLYLVLLPSLKAPLMVHAHDIFLPFGMPTNWASEQHFHGTEQYLLYAYLLNNNNARVVFGSIYATHFMASEAGRLMRNRHSVGGGSLWFQINESGDAGFQPEALFT